MILVEYLNSQFSLAQNLDFFIRILTASLCGACIGFERSKRYKEAGIRTHIIVCCAASLMMIVSKYGFADLTDAAGAAYNGTRGADAARIAAQVVSGISFLGAGTILVTRQNQVKGLTTAAGLWAVACLGLALGAGFYSGALICFAALWISIQILRFVDKRLQTHSKTIAIYIEFTKIADLSAFMTFAGANNCTISNLEMTRSNPTDRDASVSATMILHFEAATEYAQVVEIYGALDGIIMMKAL